MDKLDKTWFCTTNIQWTELVCEFTNVVELSQNSIWNFLCVQHNTVRTVLTITIPALELSIQTVFDLCFGNSLVCPQISSNRSKTRRYCLSGSKQDHTVEIWHWKVRAVACGLSKQLSSFCDMGNESTSESIHSSADLKTVFWTEEALSSARSMRYARVLLIWLNQNVCKPTIFRENGSGKS